MVMVIIYIYCACLLQSYNGFGGDGLSASHTFSWELRRHAFANLLLLHIWSSSRAQLTACTCTSMLRSILNMKCPPVQTQVRLSFIVSDPGTPRTSRTLFIEVGLSLIYKDWHLVLVKTPTLGWDLLAGWLWPQAVTHWLQSPRNRDKLRTPSTC